MMKKHFYIIVFMLTMFFACTGPACSLPEAFETDSPDIAILAENQGMITYDVHLRNDGKFVCNNDGSYTYGSFTYDKDTLLLLEECDKRNLLCFEYFIDSSADLGGFSLAIPLCNTTCKGKYHEDLWFAEYYN